MKDLRKLDKFRNIKEELKISGQFGHPLAGFFEIPSPIDNKTLRVIVSADPSSRWDHVSVSRKDRCPNWQEMCKIKELFFEENETAMQLHPPKAEWVNNHPKCLHLWRPMYEEIPRPPGIMVGIAELNPKQAQEFVKELRR